MALPGRDRLAFEAKRRNNELGIDEQNPSKPPPSDFKPMTKIRPTSKARRRDAIDDRGIRRRFVRLNLKREMQAYIEQSRQMRADNKTPWPWPTHLTVWLAKRASERA